MNSSQLQQHSSGSTQSIAHGFDVEGLAGLVEAISGAIETEELSADQRTELLAELGTLRAQATSSKPKAGIISESLKTVRRILEEAAGHVLVERSNNGFT
jgi:hypothetical protein